MGGSKHRDRALDAIPAYGDEGRSGSYQTSGLPEGGEVAWRAKTRAAVMAPPVLAGDTLFVTDAAGSVYAFDAATGKVRWQHRIVDAHPDDGPVMATAPAVWRDLIFVDEEVYEHLYVLSRRTGEVLERLPEGGCPTVIGDALVIAHSDVRALQLPGLAPRWHRGKEPSGGWLQANLALSPSGTAFAAIGFESNRHHGGLCAFNPSTGQELFFLGDHEDATARLFTSETSTWLATTRAELSKYAGGEIDAPKDWVQFDASHPVFAKGLVWMVANRQREADYMALSSVEVVGIDPRNGEIRWRYALDPGIESMVAGAVAVVEGLVLFGAWQGDLGDEASGKWRLFAIDVQSRQRRWVRPLPGAPVGSVVSASGVVYVATHGGTVLAFDGPTGAKRWALKAGAKIIDKRAMDRENGYGEYHEEALAVLPGDGILYVRTSKGIAALR